MGGLDEMIITLQSREANYYRNKRIKRDPLPYDDLIKIERKKPLIEIAKEKVKEDVAANATIMSYAMRGYLKDLEQYDKKQREAKQKISDKTS